VTPTDDAAPAAAIEAVYLGLGSNQGDRRGHLRDAVAALARHPALEVTAVSPVYETEYVGPGEPQAPYLNACVALRTALAPAALLGLLKELERRHGRRPDSHLQPRPLDLDILVHGDRVVHDPALTLPHPRLRERAFVLAPLREIAPDLRLPDSGETVTAACARICARSGSAVRRLGELGPPEGDQ
jgi:2-amino-4-hydroxy-6-hydroxymethyldihydropteridine diphosphokinase